MSGEQLIVRSPQFHSSKKRNFMKSTNPTEIHTCNFAQLIPTFRMSLGKLKINKTRRKKEKKRRNERFCIDNRDTQIIFRTTLKHGTTQNHFIGVV